MSDSYGLTDRKEINMLSRLVKKKRWKVTSKIKREAVALCERIMGDETARSGVRLKAVDILMRMEAMNQLDERIQIEIDGKGGGKNDEPSVVLILPPNGTESGRESFREEEIIESEVDGEVIEE